MTPLKVLWNALLLTTFLYSPCARAGTVYVPSKEYAWEWGPAPWDFDSGLDQIRAWLETKTAPRLQDAPKALRRVIVRYHELETPVTVKFAVLGAPRSKNGHSPVFYAWIEWVTKSKFAFDLWDKRLERKAGVATLAMEGAGENSLDLRDWQWEKDLRETPLQKIFPSDAAVIAKKMLDLHLNRPRKKEDKPAGPGRDAPY